MTIKTIVRAQLYAKLAYEQICSDQFVLHAYKLITNIFNHEKSNRITTIHYDSNFLLKKK